MNKNMTIHPTGILILGYRHCRDPIGINRALFSTPTYGQQRKIL